MRIGIEAQRIFRKKKHGMDIVALELIKELQQTDNENEYFIFVKKGDDRSCLNTTANFHIVEVPGITYADWEQLFLPFYAAKYKLDVLHCTSNTAPVMYRGRTVITLHDVIFLEQVFRTPSNNWYQRFGKYYRRWIVPASVRRAERVLTVSKFEQKRIQQVLRLSDRKISVVYNAFGKHFLEKQAHSKIEEVKLKYRLPDEYIFYIGNTDPKKNIYNTILAYKKYYMSATQPLPLVIADVTQAFLDSVLEKTDSLSLKSCVTITGYINNSDLPAIYSGATLFLYPSLRESFGIPVLESMASGTPVLTSNISALPEIAGKAAMYVNPYDETEIAETMTKLLTDTNTMKHLVDQGYQRIQEFSWNESARKLKTIYSTL